MDSKRDCNLRGLMLIWRMRALKRIELDRNDGNLEHVIKHGVARSEIEQVFRNDPLIVPDPYPGSVEERWRAIGKNDNDRRIFVVYTYRLVGNGLRVRPNSARYMRNREIESYEET